MIFELVQPTIHRAVDPWDITARSQCSSTSSVSKDIIIKYYNLGYNECMICGRSKNVVNAHIWPKHTKGDHLLTMFGLTAESLNDPRNFLRLNKSLERAFDNKSVTIILESTKLVLFVLNPTLNEQLVSNTKFTFRDCHLWPLSFKNSNRPFLRILAAHCRNAFTDAYRLQMIDYETYQMGYRSSKAMMNTSPHGAKAKICDWFKRNDKLIQNEKQS